ncbi:MAG: 6-bladed beta-propeller [Niabella sp.]
MKGKLILLLACMFIAYMDLCAQPKMLYFDPQTAVGGSVGNMLTDVEYIPLETTKESLFGDIAFLVVTDKYIVVYDRDTNRLYFFDKQGKFIKRYEDNKTTIRHLQYDAVKNALLIYDIKKSYNLSQKELQDLNENPRAKDVSKFAGAYYYYLEDVRKERIEKVRNFRYVLANPVLFDKDKFVSGALYANKNAKDSIAYELKVIGSDGNVLQNYLPYNQHNANVYAVNPGNIRFFKTARPDSLLFTRPYHYSFYALTPGGVKELYKLILPMGISVPEAFEETPFKNGFELDEYRARNNSFAWGIKRLLPYGQYLFFELDIFRNARNSSFLYDTNKGTVYNLSKIASDSTNTYLPLWGNPVYNFDDGYTYTYQSSLSMFGNMKEMASKTPQYPPVLKTYFDNSKESANPVIVRFKIKENK